MMATWRGTAAVRRRMYAGAVIAATGAALAQDPNGAWRVVPPFDGFGNNLIRPDTGAAPLLLQPSSSVWAEASRWAPAVESVVGALYSSGHAPDAFGRNMLHAMFGKLVAWDVVETSVPPCPLATYTLERASHDGLDAVPDPDVTDLAARAAIVTGTYWPSNCRPAHPAPSPSPTNETVRSSDWRTAQPGDLVCTWPDVVWPWQRNASSGGNSSGTASQALPSPWPWPSNTSITPFLPVEAAEMTAQVPLQRTLVGTVRGGRTVVGTEVGDESRSSQASTLGGTDTGSVPSAATPFLDASFLYGSEITALSARTGSSGLLDEQRVIHARAQAVPAMNHLLSIWVRLHNYVAANVVASAHPRWSDDAIFARARVITIAIFQHVTVNEYLPSLGIELPAYGGYDATLSPAPTAAFSAALRAIGHSQVSALTLTVAGTINDIMNDTASSGGCVFARLARRAANATASPIASVRRLCTALMDEERAPQVSGAAATGDDGDTAAALRGLQLHQQAAVGLSMAPDLRRFVSMHANVWASLPYPLVSTLQPTVSSATNATSEGEAPPLAVNHHIRADLAAMDLATGRHSSIGSYNAVRSTFGLARAATFAEITTDASLATLLTRVYRGDVDAVDFAIGGLAESSSLAVVAGIGPLFRTVISSTIARLRDADRYWYEHVRGVDGGNATGAAAYADMGGAWPAAVWAWSAADVAWVKTISMALVLSLTVGGRASAGRSTDDGSHGLAGANASSPGFANKYIEAAAHDPASVWFVPATLRCTPSDTAAAMASLPSCVTSYVNFVSGSSSEAGATAVTGSQCLSRTSHTAAGDLLCYAVVDPSAATALAAGVAITLLLCATSCCAVWWAQRAARHADATAAAGTPPPPPKHKTVEAGEASNSDESAEHSGSDDAAGDAAVPSAPPPPPSPSMHIIHAPAASTGHPALRAPSVLALLQWWNEDSISDVVACLIMRYPPAQPTPALAICTLRHIFFVAPADGALLGHIKLRSVVRAVYCDVCGGAAAAGAAACLAIRAETLGTTRSMAVRLQRSELAPDSLRRLLTALAARTTRPRQCEHAPADGVGHAASGAVAVVADAAAAGSADAAAAAEAPWAGLRWRAGAATAHVLAATLAQAVATVSRAQPGATAPLAIGDAGDGGTAPTAALGAADARVLRAVLTGRGSPADVAAVALAYADLRAVEGGCGNDAAAVALALVRRVVLQSGLHVSDASARAVAEGLAQLAEGEGRGSREGDRVGAWQRVMATQQLVSLPGGDEARHERFATVVVHRAAASRLHGHAASFLARSPAARTAPALTSPSAVRARGPGAGASPSTRVAVVVMPPSPAAGVAATAAAAPTAGDVAAVTGGGEVVASGPRFPHVRGTSRLLVSPRLAPSGTNNTIRLPGGGTGSVGGGGSEAHAHRRTASWLSSVVGQRFPAANPGTASTSNGEQGSLRRLAMRAAPLPAVASGGWADGASLLAVLAQSFTVADVNDGDGDAGGPDAAAAFREGVATGDAAAVVVTGAGRDADAPASPAPVTPAPDCPLHGAAPQPAPPPSLARTLRALWRRASDSWLRLVWLALLLACCSAIVASELTSDQARSPRRAMLRAVLGPTFALARITAQLALFCGLVLYATRLKKLWTLARDTLPVSHLLPVDDLGLLHTLAGYGFALCALLHTYAHLHNFHLAGHLTPATAACVFNRVCAPGVAPVAVTTAQWLFTTLPGITGLLLVLLLALMVPCSTELVRRTAFGAFYAVHRVHILIVPLLLLHGAWQVLASPRAAVYLVTPCLLYLGEKYAALVTEERNTVAVVAAELLPGKAVRLTLERPPHFSFRSGQFVAITVPALGRSAPHPFTVSSAPQEQHLQLTIKAVGPWTHRLRALVLQELRAAEGSGNNGGVRWVQRPTTTAVSSRGEGGSAAMLHQLTALAKRGTMDTSFSRSDSAGGDGDDGAGSAAIPGGAAGGQGAIRPVDGAGSRATSDAADAAPDDAGDSLTPHPPASAASAHTALVPRLDGAATAPLTVVIDGPHGAPSQEWYRYRTVVLVAGGIGVTPMLSVMCDVVQRIRARRAGFHSELRTCSVTLVWVARTLAEASWLRRLARQVERADRHLRMVQIALYITAQASWADAQVCATDGGTGDVVVPAGTPFNGCGSGAAATRLTAAQLGFERTTVSFQRPHWPELMRSVRRDHAGETSVGVFACGPKPLLAALAAAIRSANALSPALGPVLHGFEERF